MKRQILSSIQKIFYLIPYVFVVSLSDILSAKPGEQSLSDVLWYRILGRVSAGNLHTLVLSVESLGIIFLFTFLFGDYISNYFGSICTIVFTRIRNRTFWGIKKVLELCGYSVFYTFLLLELKFLIGIRNVKEWSFDETTLQTCIVLFGVIFPLVVTVCLLVNWISIRYGIPIAIISVFIVVICLEFIAILAFDQTANLILNPLCFNIAIRNTPKYAFMKIVVDFFYLFTVSGSMIFYIKRRDIF